MKLAKLIKSVILVVTLFSSLVAAAAAEADSLGFIPYYGEDFYKDYKNNVSGDDLVFRLKSVLRSFHAKRAGSYDLVVDKCEGVGSCYYHTPIRYKEARRLVVGSLYMSKDSNDAWQIYDVYCQRNRGAEDFGGKLDPKSASEGKAMNVEHTWPQSLFNRMMPKDTQKTDLHHLFPADSQMNAIRGNHLFGEVTQDEEILRCPDSRYGLGTAGSEEVFEPPKTHKGNAARALFYFSIRYDLKIDDREEAVLRKWNQEDPVDQAEIDRNNQIFEIQKNRNPFVDFPELVDRVSNF